VILDNTAGIIDAHTVAAGAEKSCLFHFRGLDATLADGLLQMTIEICKTRFD
jgi:hypothetical protein